MKILIKQIQKMIRNIQITNSATDHKWKNIMYYIRNFPSRLAHKYMMDLYWSRGDSLEDRIALSHIEDFDGRHIEKFFKNGKLEWSWSCLWYYWALMRYLKKQKVEYKEYEEPESEDPLSFT